MLALYIAWKIQTSQQSYKFFSKIIILISQIVVIVGFFIILFSLSIGIGIKKSIKQRLVDFNGHLVLKSFNLVHNYNSSIFELDPVKLNLLKQYNDIVHIQQFATLSGVIQNDISFEGLIFKGVSHDFDILRFNQFLIKGKFPILYKNFVSNEIIMSSKMARYLNLTLQDNFIMYFISNNNTIICKKFKIVGIFNTYIKNIDDNYIIGDINQIRNINRWTNNEIGGYEVYLSNIDNSSMLMQKLFPILGCEVVCETINNMYSQIITWLNLFDINVYILIFITFFIILINMIMIFLILIIERVSFIGIMKMLGMTNFELQKIFVSYTLFIMLPGLIIGNVLSLLCITCQKKFNIITLNPENYFFKSVPVDLNLMYFLYVSCFLFLIALIVLTMSSYLIGKLNIIKILKFS